MELQGSGPSPQQEFTVVHQPVVGKLLVLPKTSPVGSLSNPSLVEKKDDLVVDGP